MLKTLFQNKHLRRRTPKINLTSEHDERKVNRLDLFFDLVFVVTIWQLAHMFHWEITWKIIVEYVILFVPVWRVRIGSTYYVARFEDNSVRHRVYMMMLIIPVLWMWYAIHWALSELAVRYVWCYVVAKSILAWLRYTWCSWQNQSKDLKNVGINMTIATIVVIVLWISSLWIEWPRRYILWFLTMIWELMRAWTQRSDTEDDIPDFHMGHLSERFWLFTIIVLAEIIIWVFAWMNELYELTLSNVVTSIATFLIACLLWWVYFDQIMSRPLKTSKWENAQLFLWSYGHLPLTLWIVAVGWWLVHIVNSHEHMNELTMWVVVVWLCIVLITIWMLAQFHESRTETWDSERDVDLSDRDDVLNKHLLLSKWIGAVAVLIRWAIRMHSHLEMYWFVIGIVLILALLALEWLLYRVSYMSKR